MLLGFAATGYATGQILAPPILVAAVVAHTVVMRLHARQDKESRVEKSILLVRTNPAPGREGEFNQWYDNEHVPDILKLPGFTRASRYVVHSTSDGQPPEFKYLTIYEIDGPVDEALKAIAQAGLTPSDSMDPKVSVLPYVAHTPGGAS
ncbi:DUF4286 family protein [Pseudonocardia thermophila]|uniref:DUF4286 family protein n=1 Tax=Pseudonocardia thermophila TaxID=1848 RepID=UPI00248D803F|nr:DUF4286 family protein [Pseudonocardia thermophila]